MESSTFDRLTRLFGRSTARRAALTATAATGLAALTAGSVSGQEEGVEGARHRRVLRGRRGPRGLRGKPGKPGKQGPPGPAAGAGIKVVTQACVTPADQNDGATHGCTAQCGNGFVATGGGYQMGNLFSDLAIVRQSMPALNANNVPEGWFVQVEFLNLGSLTYDIYAVCVPE